MTLKLERSTNAERHRPAVAASQLRPLQNCEESSAAEPIYMDVLDHDQLHAAAEHAPEAKIFQADSQEFSLTSCSAPCIKVSIRL